MQCHTIVLDTTGITLENTKNERLATCTTSALLPGFKHSNESIHARLERYDDKYVLSRKQ